MTGVQVTLLESILFSFERNQFHVFEDDSYVNKYISGQEQEITSKVHSGFKEKCYCGCIHIVLAFFSIPIQSWKVEIQDINKNKNKNNKKCVWFGMVSHSFKVLYWPCCICIIRNIPEILLDATAIVQVSLLQTLLRCTWARNAVSDTCAPVCNDWCHIIITVINTQIWCQCGHIYAIYSYIRNCMETCTKYISFNKK